MASPDTLIPRQEPSTDLFVSETAFKVVVWLTTAICIVVSALRFTIRFLTFRRLFNEDYFMLFSVLCLIALASVLQHFLGYMYLVLEMPTQVKMPDRIVLEEPGLRTALTLNTVGIWAIKLNFLAFFRRFGIQIRSYMISWWVASFLVVSCGLVQIGVILAIGSQFDSLALITENLIHVYTIYKASIALDVISDAIIICFPVFIAWRSGITIRQKLVLTGVFLLVGFTVAVTIVRGNIFGGVYKAVGDADHIRVLNIGWLLFWFMIQYIVSFMIACIISFRSLWVNKRDKNNSRRFQLDQRQRAAEDLSPPDSRQRRGPRSRWQDSVLQTLADLEAKDLEPEPDSNHLLEQQPPSETMMADLSNRDRGENDGSAGARRESSSRRETLDSSQSRNNSPL
ncbi:hypothetical protein PG997_014755 [Apiospora hydei]|uniref:Rhodopsin domain-containing protein n=1 Tax=Apiospora hydei TaxID=1337664 RepID=A0ABR1UY01_9PEZI